ncbi:hypothetical protein [Sulfuriroseicoccus oceanibius]|uniref:Uncharacterized protein n=1 Tax=Sulfuriroseicoccus oceanibius TaxID=2707525 RepID=A0A7T7EZS9_9BACT|nr:hypothetical protein [Sulfuriroseicoccus oceanibius]QQL44059.1 hypothetical protein G3M56_009150 [Sulfuriroseicoccus oceanibius]
MESKNNLENQLARLKTLLSLILAVLLLNIGYIATPFGKTQLGEVVGVLALIASAMIIFVVALRALAIGVKQLKKIGDEVEAARSEEYKKEVEVE